MWFGASTFLTILILNHSFNTNKGDIDEIPSGAIPVVNRETCFCILKYLDKDKFLKKKLLLL